MTMVAPNPALTPGIDEVEGRRRSLLGIVVGLSGTSRSAPSAC